MATLLDIQTIEDAEAFLRRFFPENEVSRLRTDSDLVQGINAIGIPFSVATLRTLRCREPQNRPPAALRLGRRNLATLPATLLWLVNRRRSSSKRPDKREAA